jgi:Zn finger protein HypA/HybF involved in hydrogenase expression
LSCPLCEGLDYELMCGRELDLQSVSGEIVDGS